MFTKLSHAKPKSKLADSPPRKQNIISIGLLAQVFSKGFRWLLFYYVLVNIHRLRQSMIFKSSGFFSPRFVIGNLPVIAG